MTDLTREQIGSVTIGSAIGDALGEPVEFLTRDELDASPVTDLRDNPEFGLPVGGTWSDDTSMALCALDVLADGKNDPDRVMVNFGLWDYTGKFTPTGAMFDIGTICATAIDNYFAFRKPIGECGLDGERSNGNGSLMRIYPYALYLYGKEMTDGEKINGIHAASAMTHAHERSLVGCGICSFILWELLRDPGKASVYRAFEKAEAYYRENGYGEIGAYAALFDRLADLSREKIKSTGYVVDTLTAAVWCLLTTDSYAECVLRAVNLGDDTDTTASVAGGLAGALYGLDGIPEKWRRVLVRREWMEEMCVRAERNWRKNG